MEQEIWKDIPGYKGLYQASNLGRIKALNYKNLGIEKVLKLSLHKYNNCLYVGLNKKSISVHQLIAMAFLNHTPNGNKLVIDHINSNPLDNRVENLRIVTQRQNCSKERTQKSGLPVGVRLNKNRYNATIVLNGKTKHIGNYDTVEEASKAYQKELNNIN